MRARPAQSSRTRLKIRRDRLVTRSFIGIEVADSRRGIAGGCKALRAIAWESDGQIISGRKGYKLTSEARLEEISETAWLRSEGKEMIRRGIAIQRAAHPILAGAER